MRTRSLFFLYVIILFLLQGCADQSANDPREAFAARWADASYRAGYIQKHRRQNYEISNTSDSQLAAVQNLVHAFSDPESDPALWILNEREHREILWPNLPETSADRPEDSPLAHYTIVKTFQSIALGTLRGFPRDQFSVSIASYRKPSEKHLAITRHFPELIEVRNIKTGQITKLKTIKEIIEHAGQFKVSRVAP